MEVIEKKATQRKLTAPRFKNAEYERTIWQASIEAGVPFEDVQKPEFWGHVAENLKPLARIEVIAEDLSYFAELIVIDCDRLWAKTQVLRFVDLRSDVAEDLLPAMSSGFKVEYKGPTKKHVVIRLADNEIVQEGIATKAEANAWVAEHLKALR